jgi:hypothetical protein
MAPPEEELLEMLAASPLSRMLEEGPKRKDLPRPPVPLGRGHIAMLLASGTLDGIVRPDGEPPHVVRGVARKQEVLVSAETEDNGKTVKTVERYQEQIKLIVRTLGQDGIVRTFS